ncbi:MAG TPA: class GN sortase [Thermoanaerobaculia bacterium]|nr:class GN sortase [Thermoanaerobaculia bacterium]
MRRAVTAAVLVAGIAFAAQGAWIHVKASLAQLLLEMSWRAARAGRPAVKPWPWADTHAVARLEVGGKSVIVLSGASGRTMAFGPGHVDGTALPGRPGNCVITAHRDTHFAALRDVVAGDTLILHTAGGQRIAYEAKRMMVVGDNETWVMEDDGTDRLTLITCYPFDAVIPGGPLRYVVIGERPAPSPFTG